MSLLTTNDELAAACDRFSGHPFVTVDTEFLRETTFWPKVCVIQLASPEEAVGDRRPRRRHRSVALFRADGQSGRRQGLPRGAPGPRDHLAAGAADPGAAVRHPGRRHGLRLRRTGLLSRAGQGDHPRQVSTNPRASPIGRAARCRRPRSNTPSPTSPIFATSTRPCARAWSAPTGSTGSSTRCRR